MTREEHLDLLRRAIAANLDAREEHDRRQARAAEGKPIELKWLTADKLMNTLEERLYLEAVIEDPIRKALKRQLNLNALDERTLAIYASLVWASADLALPDSGYSVG
jgi:hypothetical protein